MSLAVIHEKKANPAIEIRRLMSDSSAWDRFVHSCSEASFFHLSGWRKVLEEAFGHKTFYLQATRVDEIVAVLPLAQVKSFLFGNSLVSLPFCVYGGAVGDPEACRLLELEAAKLARELDVDYLELRNRTITQPNWPCKSDLYVTFRKSIDADAETNLLSIPRKQRAMIRKAITAGLESKQETGVNGLYAAYSESVRNLGTPVFSKRYFKTLRQVFGDDCRVLSVYQGPARLAGVMSFYFRNEVLPYYGGGVAAARDLKANDFMYWELMRRSCEAGVGLFDYGRSKRGTGSYRFKKHWGFEEESLHYQYYLVKAKTVPNLSPSNPKYRFFINVWRRLPLWLSQLLGPYVSRSLG